MDRLKERDRLWNYRAGLAAAAIYNVNRSKRTDKLIQPLDLFGQSTPRGPSSAREILRRLNAVHKVKNAKSR